MRPDCGGRDRRESGHWINAMVSNTSSRLVCESCWRTTPASLSIADDPLRSTWTIYKHGASSGARGSSPQSLKEDIAEVRSFCRWKAEIRVLAPLTDEDIVSNTNCSIGN